jgi:hypothetical protein
MIIEDFKPVSKNSVAYEIYKGYAIDVLTTDDGFYYKILAIRNDKIKNIRQMGYYDCAEKCLTKAKNYINNYQF